MVNYNVEMQTKNDVLMTVDSLCQTRKSLRDCESRQK